jgi:hypothetical protein
MDEEPEELYVLDFSNAPGAAEYREQLENDDATAARSAARAYCDLAKARSRQLLALTGGKL